MTKINIQTETQNLEFKVPDSWSDISLCKFHKLIPLLSMLEFNRIIVNEGTTMDLITIIQNYLEIYGIQQAFTDQINDLNDYIELTLFLFTNPSNKEGFIDVYDKKEWLTIATDIATNEGLDYLTVLMAIATASSTNLEHIINQYYIIKDEPVTEYFDNLIYILPEIFKKKTKVKKTNKKQIIKSI